MIWKIRRFRKRRWHVLAYKRRKHYRLWLEDNYISRFQVRNRKRKGFFLDRMNQGSTKKFCFAILAKDIDLEDFRRKSIEFGFHAVKLTRPRLQTLFGRESDLRNVLTSKTNVILSHSLEHFEPNLEMLNSEEVLDSAIFPYFYGCSKGLFYADIWSQHKLDPNFNFMLSIIKVVKVNGYHNFILELKRIFLYKNFCIL